MYNQFGYYALMRYKEKNQEHEMKEAILHSLKDEELIKISFTENSAYIIWEDDHQKEFTLQGELYDVVRSSHENGRFYLYCINDKKEKELIDQYNDQTKQNTSTEKKAKLSSHFSMSLFLSEKPEDPHSFSQLIINNYQTFASQIIPGISSITPPPPKG